MPTLLIDAPPRSAFELPGGHRHAYSTKIEDDGRVHGYPAASWDDCHLSYADQCVTPPRSATGYAYFTTGEVACDDGSRVRVGQLTLRGGHADRTLSAAQAMAHYDNTDSAFADVAIGEDEHGIWIAGMLRPTLTAAGIRTAMASGLSGDWRLIGGHHELIALSAVNTPGFRPRAELFERDGLVASMIIDLPSIDPEPATAAGELEADPADVVDSPVVDDVDGLGAGSELAGDEPDQIPSGGEHGGAGGGDDPLAGAVERIASTIGMSTDQRLQALRDRVAGNGLR